MAYRNPNIYKLLVMFIYGEYKWMERQGDGFIEIRTSPCAVQLNMSASALRNTLRWCAQFHYISQLENGYGYSRFRINKPKLLLKEYGYDV